MATSLHKSTSTKVSCPLCLLQPDLHLQQPQTIQEWLHPFTNPPSQELVPPSAIFNLISTSDSHGKHSNYCILPRIYLYNSTSPPQLCPFRLDLHPQPATKNRSQYILSQICLPDSCCHPCIFFCLISTCNVHKKKKQALTSPHNSTFTLTSHLLCLQQSLKTELVS